MAQQKCLDKEDSYYHVYNRGVNKQNIFLDHFDRYYFLKLCRKSKQKFDTTFHAFCLMNNHYHLLMHTSKANLSKVMKYIGESYSKYYVSKYKSLKKSGHTFMGRYGRKIIETNEYLDTLFTYIHLNPVKDKFANNPKEYKWSSYCSYLEDEDKFDLLNIETLKSHFYKQTSLDDVVMNNQLLQMKKESFTEDKIVNSELMKKHLKEYNVDNATFNKLYTYCMLEWTELDSHELSNELKVKPSTIRKMKSDIKFEIEDNNHLLQNLIYSVRKSLGLF